jgi:aminotransferase
MDNGWNSEIAVSNIEKIVSKLGIDLVTHVIDWEEIKDLQRSFFRASIANIEVVTDHAIFALLYHECAKREIRYQISGSNVATESILPRSWGYDARDVRHILAIHERFGGVPLTTYPVLDPWTFIYYVFVKRIKFIPILNYQTYVKAEAIKRLKSALGWLPYGHKHGESKFTHFYQGYVLPQKMKADKRKAHYSSLICANQMTRHEALSELNKPPYDHRELEEDIEYVVKKLGFTKNELENFLSEPPKSHRDYPSYWWIFSNNNRLTQLVRKIAKGQ